jgi:signal transduction histidine kinase
MSLATRLSAFFLVALALVLAGFSTTLYLLARSHLQRDLDEHLVDSLNTLTAAAHVSPGMHGWQPGTRPPIAGEYTPETPVYWVVYDARGKLLDRFGDPGSEDFSAALSRIPRIGHTHLTFTSRDGRRWRLAARRMHVLASGLGQDESEEADEHDQQPNLPKAWFPGETAVMLVVGTPQQPLEASLRNAAWLLAGLSTGLWLMAALAGRRLCRRALLPVTQMARAACSMSADHQDQRLPSPGTRDELEDMARSFNDLLGRMHEAFERQKRFTGEASHQLRTPLTALISEIEVARRRERTVADYQQILDQIHGDAVRLCQIVEGLLFLARAESEAGLPEVQPIDLASWVPSYLDHWSSHPRGCDIQAEPPGASPVWVRAHAPLLGQLLDNLLDNACKYSPPGTPVRVRLGREPGFVTIAVEDRGPGLSAEEAAHVFEPFYRSPQARLRGEPGVGLGLAVVARIAATFGGCVEADCKLGEGCRFVVRLPEASGPTPSKDRPGEGQDSRLVRGGWPSAGDCGSRWPVKTV